MTEGRLALGLVKFPSKLRAGIKAVAIIFHFDVEKVFAGLHFRLQSNMNF